MSVLRRALTARTARTAALAGIAAGAALSLTACNTDTGSDAVAAPTAAASGATSGSGGSANSGSSGGSAAGSSSGTGSAAGSSAAGAAAQGGAAEGGRCHTADLNIFFGGRQNSSDTGHTQTVALANKSRRTCTVQGFPGVDLKDATHTWSLVRSSAATPKVTLAPGDVTSFRITFLPFEQGTGSQEFTPTTAVITPPNETTSVTLKWEAGSLVLQDGATHPGTFVNPVVPNVSS